MTKALTARMASSAQPIHNFVSHIGELRRERGLSQRDLAHAVEVSENTIAGWEKAIPKPFAIAFKICAFFETEIQSQFDGDNFEALLHIAQLREHVRGGSISQRQLAQAIGVTNNTISTWERGNNQTVGKLQRLCATLKEDLRNLYKESIPPDSTEQPWDDMSSHAAQQSHQDNHRTKEHQPEASQFHPKAPASAPLVQRQDFSQYHSLLEIFGLSLCAIMGGAETWIDVVHYADAKKEWLQKFLLNPQDLPTSTELASLFAFINPAYLQANLQDITQAIAKQSNVIIRNDHFSPSTNCKQASTLQLITWAQSQRLTLANPNLEEEDSHLTSQILGGLNITGKNVVIDTRRDPLPLAQKIISKRGDYIIRLTGNDNLYENAQQLFNWAINKPSKEVDFYQTIEDSGQDLPEIRRHWILNRTEYLANIDKWPQLESIGVVESTQDLPNAPHIIERRYYLLSSTTTAKGLAHSVNSHWNIKNPTEWLIDVSQKQQVFGTESSKRNESDYTTANLNLLKQHALNLLAQDASTLGGLTARRLKAGWDNKYLLNILAATNT